MRAKSALLSESSSQTRRAFMRRRKALDLRDVVAVDCLRGDLAAAPAQTRTVRQLRHELDIMERSLQEVESSRPARLPPTPPPPPPRRKVLDLRDF